MEPLKTQSRQLVLEQEVEDYRARSNKAFENNAQALHRFVSAAKRYSREPIATPRVLVVSPDATLVAHWGRSMVELWGTSVKSSTTAQGALTLLQDHPYDLVIVDLKLSDSPGWELVTEIRLKSLRPLVPVIITSAVQVDLPEIAKKCGANTYLTEPFNTASLKTEIKRVFRLEQTSDFPVVAMR